MPIKIITKADALKLTLRICYKVKSCDELIHGASVSYESKTSSQYSDKWRFESWRISGDDFYISCNRRKHSDGRIRDNFSMVDGQEDFAKWALTHFPEESADFVRVQFA